MEELLIYLFYLVYMGILTFIEEHANIINIAVTLFVGLSSIILLYITLKKQSKIAKDQSNDLKIERFENHFFQLIQAFNDLINSQYFYDEKKELHGKEVFKYFSLMYIKEFLKNSNDKNLAEKFILIKTSNHSNYISIFKTITYIYDFIMQHDKSVDSIYLKYLRISLPEYLKFIISLYYIYDSDCSSAIKLKNEVKIIDKYDFINFLTNENKFVEFHNMLKLK